MWGKTGARKLWWWLKKHDGGVGCLWWWWCSDGGFEKMVVEIYVCIARKARSFILCLISMLSKNK